MATPQSVIKVIFKILMFLLYFDFELPQMRQQQRTVAIKGRKRETRKLETTMPVNQG